MKNINFLFYDNLVLPLLCRHTYVSIFGGFIKVTGDAIERQGERL